MKGLGIIALLAVCTGCASKPPSSVGLAVVDDVTLATVREAGDTYEGSTVRWGGVITAIENKPDHTLVFVAARALENNEQPLTDSASDGRFVARFDGFLDPLVYKTNRRLTVVGRIEGSLVRKIGEFDYRFPLGAVRDSRLFAEALRPRPYYYPDPWLYHSHFYHPFPHRHSHW